MKSYVGWLIVLSALGLGFALGGTRLESAQAAAAKRVGLIVSYGNGTVKNQCISFSKDTISGLGVLQASGLPLAVSYNSTGAAVCKIGKVGCPAKNCFCDSPPNFWTYWHLKDGNWVFSQLGASSYSAGDGDVEGWVWGTGQSDPPDPVAFDQICAAQPTPSETFTPGPTQEPTITPTRKPSKTPAPTQEASQTPVPATDGPTATQPPEQATAVFESAQQLDQPTGASAAIAMAPSAYLPLVLKDQDASDDTLMPTAAAAISTPDTSASSTQAAATLQAGQDGSTSAAGSNKGPSSYLFLGVIVAGLGIGIFGMMHKKWK